jgi:hypothetical protein
MGNHRMPKCSKVSRAVGIGIVAGGVALGGVGLFAAPADTGHEAFQFGGNRGQGNNGGNGFQNSGNQTTSQNNFGGGGFNLGGNVMSDSNNNVSVLNIGGSPSNRFQMFGNRGQGNNGGNVFQNTGNQTTRQNNFSFGGGGANVGGNVMDDSNNNVSVLNIGGLFLN